VRAVAFNARQPHLLTAGGRYVQRWNLDGAKIGEPLKHDDAVLSVLFSLNGEWIATGCTDGSVRLWDANTGRFVKLLPEKFGRVYALAFSPNSETLLVGSMDNWASLWEVKSGTLLCRWRLVRTVRTWFGHVISAGQDSARPPFAAASLERSEEMAIPASLRGSPPPIFFRTL
jgi:WD40 repeat protein